MRLGQLEDEIKQCEKHLDETGKRNTEAESYFVRYLLVRICAEYETRIATLVQRRCSRINDPHILNFVSWAARFSSQRFNIGDITGMLGKFGDDYKDCFSVSIPMDCKAFQAWNNIYVNRHTVAHGNGAVMMSLPELKTAFADSMVVIDELVKALCLRPKDIAGLK